ncbi:response regulator [Desulfosoma sp.]
METIRVLLVDDEVEFLDTLLKRMRKRQVEVAGVYSAEEALRYLESSPVDVVVLDVKMPGMDGIDALKAIKERHPLVEVIMLTGHANVEVAIQGMELGAFDYLMKPMDIDELLYKVQDACKKKRLHEKRMLKRKGVKVESDNGGV